MKLLSLILLAASSSAAAATVFTGFGKPFTAKNANPSDRGAIYDLSFKGNRSRAVRAEDPQYWIVSDYKESKNYFVFDKDKAYYESKGTVDESFFDPCIAQKKAAQQGQKLTCKKTGTEEIDGRKTDKYETTMEGADQSLESYFDPELKVVIKQKNEDGSDKELTDIKVGAAKGPFEVPAGYRKLTEKEYNAMMIKLYKSRGKK